MTADLADAQPLGAFGFPAGMLLLSSEDAGPAAAELSAGRVPTDWPDSLSGHRLVHADDFEAAREAFAGDDPLARYHRWLLDSETTGVGEAADIRAGLPSAYAPLVDVVLHTHGLGPAPALDAGLTPEVQALALAAHATDALAAGDSMAAIDLMGRAAETAPSPATAAVLRGNLGLLRHESQVGDARADLAAAAEALADTDLGEVRAMLLLRLGSIAQETAARGEGDARALLEEAMGHYYEGLRCVTETSAPYVWASLTMNLATAHLAVPMEQASDQLRLGVATQGLRACRRVLTHDTHPGPWSAATLNLANALVYTPSTHQGDNLVEAVELYEEVLESGVRDHDPLGRARLLANQGNVLAHLGAFDVARPKLVEARYLFESHLDHDGAHTVRGLLDELVRAESAAGYAAAESETDFDAGFDADALARQAEQMSRMPVGEGAFTSGMGVTVTSHAGDQIAAPPTPRVTVVPAESRPTQASPIQERP